MHQFNFVPQLENTVNVVPSKPFQMYTAPNNNVVVPQTYNNDNIQQCCQPIFFEPLPPIYVKNKLLPSPVLVQMPTTVVVQNEAHPAMILNQPPSNIIVKNTPPTSLFVKQSNPNVIMKNEPAPNYVQNVEASHETVITDTSRQLV